MKKSAIISILICSVIAAASVLATPALAEAPAAHYPVEDFIHDSGEVLGNVTDFAVSENGYAFAEAGKINVFSGEVHTPYDIPGVTKLDCTDGVFYYEQLGKSYSLPEKTETPHAFYSFNGYQTANYSYILGEDDGILYAVNIKKPSEGNTPFYGYSCIKAYNGVLYALKDGVLHTIEGLESNPVEIKYSDFSAVVTIPTGNAAQEIKDFNAETLHFVTLNAGEYVTQIDLTKLTGDYFKVVKDDGDNLNTLRVGEEGAPAGGTSALLILRTGDADIVCTDGKYYIKSAAAESGERENAIEEFDAKGTVSIALGYAYFAPHVDAGVALFELKSGDTVHVLGRALTSASPELKYDFYKIQLLDGEGNPAKDENGNELIGYVPFGYLSELGTFDEKEPETKYDEKYSENNLIRNVVLVLVVIALVLAAMGYMVFVLTSKKRRSGGN